MGHNSLAAIVGGLGGALVTSAVLFVARVLNLTELNPGLINGTLITANASTAAWTLGFGIHLLAGLLFALVYLAIFMRLGRWGWGIGAIIGLLHGLLSGTVMAVLPRFHPLMDTGAASPIPAPGFVGIHYGSITAILFVLLHIAFGAIVGLACERLGPGVAQQ